MSAEVNLKNILSSDAAVVSVVADRIYNKFVPDGVLSPAIAFIRVNTEYMNTIHGKSAEIRVSFDIFCVATADAMAENLGDLVAAIMPAPPYEMVKTNRVALYDSETELHAAVISVDVGSETSI